MKLRHDPKPMDFPKRSAAYEALSAFNQHCDQVLLRLKEFNMLGAFQGRFQRDSLNFAEATLKELRAWINFEITETLNTLEQHDHARFGQVRQTLERKYSDAKPRFPKKQGRRG